MKNAHKMLATNVVINIMNRLSNECMDKHEKWMDIK